MEATFFQRTGAYLIDIIITSFILSIICLGFGNTSSNIQEKMQELDNKLRSAEITNEDYINEYKVLLYDYQKENTLQSSISVALTIAYFVIFQYMNKGQTLGKMLLKLRIVNKDNQKPISIHVGFIRSCFILSIISNIILVIAPYIININGFIYSYITLIIIDGILLLTTILFILYRNDHRGLHDIITNTIVIKENI